MIFLEGVNMTNKDILRIAMEQSAIDANCSREDFSLAENRVVLSKENPLARKYLKLPLYCNLISYGSNIVASVHSEFTDTVKKYIDKFSIEHCFETPNMHVLNDALQEKNMRVCFMAEYFLPDMDILSPLSCNYDIKILEQGDLQGLYTKEWSNALCESRRHLDVLAAAAYDGRNLIGLAGCSADCDTMWQIGVDVLPEYRRKGIAAALTSHLTLEILRRGKVPFYCAAWSNIRSVRNAIKCGFKPAWVEMTAKPAEMIEEMNRG